MKLNNIWLVPVATLLFVGYASQSKKIDDLAYDVSDLRSDIDSLESTVRDLRSVVRRLASVVHYH